MKEEGCVKLWRIHRKLGQVLIRFRFNLPEHKVIKAEQRDARNARTRTRDARNDATINRERRNDATTNRERRSESRNAY